MPKRAFAIAVALALTACATTPRIDYDADPQANFSAYRTYSWAANSAPSGMNPLLFQRVKTAIDTTLASRGYSPAETGDFAVGFTLGARNRVEVNDFGPYGSFYRPWGGWYGYHDVSVRNVTDGTLVIDIYDTRTKAPVWHGTATKEVTSSTIDQTKVDAIVAAVLANFPPPQKAAK